MRTSLADSSGAESTRAENRDTIESSRSRPPPTRRRALATVGSALAAAASLDGTAGLVGEASAQTETTDDDAQAKVTTTMAIETAQAFEGNYVGQFVVIQSTQYSPERTPGLEDCSGVQWTIQNTKSYDGALIDRNTQDPMGVQRTIHIAPEDREFSPGSVFVVSDATECGDYVALGVEQVGPAVFRDDTANGGSTPGFTGTGVLAGLAGLLGYGALRRASGKDDE